MSGIRLIFSNADFSQHALPISMAKGTPNTTVTSRDGSYSIVFGDAGTAEIDNTITHYGSGQNGMFGVADGSVDVGITEFSPLYWDTSEWTSFYGTFMGLTNLVKLDVTHLNFEKGTDFAQMFSRCIALNTIVIHDISSSLYKSLTAAFSNCLELSNLTIGSINKVQILDSTFYNCKSLVELDLSGIDCSILTNINNTFLNCEKLETLNFKQFNSANISTKTNTFNGCVKLTTIYVDDATSAQWLITNCLSVNTGTSAYNWSYDSTNKVIARGSAI